MLDCFERFNNHDYPKGCANTTRHLRAADIADMNQIREDRCSPLLASLVKNIDLQALSRIPASRLEQNALPNIGLVELVSGECFEQHYQPLYLASFHGGERERPELIVERLKDGFAGRRAGLAPFHVIGIKNQHSVPVGAAQFSVLMLPGTRYAVPYLQYIYIRPENRRQDLSEVLHNFVLAAATAGSRASGEERIVPFTLFETDPPGHGTSQVSRTYATERTTIHAKSGSKAIMLADQAGRMFSSHVQPGLDPGDNHITLVWVLRPSPGHQSSMECDVGVLGTSLIAAYYRSLRDEGFPEQNIALAERIANARCLGRHFVEVPLADITPEMYQNLEDKSAEKSNVVG